MKMPQNCATCGENRIFLSSILKAAVIWIISLLMYDRICFGLLLSFCLLETLKGRGLISICFKNRTKHQCHVSFHPGELPRSRSLFLSFIPEKFQIYNQTNWADYRGGPQPISPNYQMTIRTSTSAVSVGCRSDRLDSCTLAWTNRLVSKSKKCKRNHSKFKTDVLFKTIK